MVFKISTEKLQKLLILPKLICGFNKIPNQIPNKICEKLILKCIWKNKEPRTARVLLRQSGARAWPGGQEA